MRAYLVLGAERGDVLLEVGANLAALLLQEDELLVELGRHQVVAPSTGSVEGKGGSRSSDVSRRFLMRPPRTFRGWRVRANGAARGAPVVLRLLPRAGGLLRDLRLERGDVDLRRTGKGGWSGQSGRPEGARRGRESSQMWFPRWRNGTERRARTPVVRLLAL